MIKIENNTITHNGKTYEFTDKIELFARLFEIEEANRSDVLQALIKKIALKNPGLFTIREYLKKRGWSSKRSIYNAADRGELTLEQVEGQTFVREASAESK